nr:callose synthase 5-like [Tanacetum cinerariifolium]
MGGSSSLNSVSAASIDRYWVTHHFGPRLSYDLVQYKQKEKEVNTDVWLILLRLAVTTVGLKPRPKAKDEVQQRKLLYMGLYLLIWGEAANVVFMPEFLCYIFHNQKEKGYFEACAIENSHSCILVLASRDGLLDAEASPNRNMEIEYPEIGTQVRLFKPNTLYGAYCLAIIQESTNKLLGKSCSKNVDLNFVGLDVDSSVSDISVTANNLDVIIVTNSDLTKPNEDFKKERKDDVVIESNDENEVIDNTGLMGFAEASNENVNGKRMELRVYERNIGSLVEQHERNVCENSVSVCSPYTNRKKAREGRCNSFDENKTEYGVEQDEYIKDLGK